MKDIMKYIVISFGRHLIKIAILLVALFPLLLVLDFGMGIQIYRDCEPLVIAGFIAALVFYATVYAWYVHGEIG